jgi:hypothetical protein
MNTPGPQKSYKGGSPLFERRVSTQHSPRNQRHHARHPPPQPPPTGLPHRRNHIRKKDFRIPKLMSPLCSWDNRSVPRASVSEPLRTQRHVPAVDGCQRCLQHVLESHGTARSCLPTFSVCYRVSRPWRFTKARPGSEWQL